MSALETETSRRGRAAPAKAAVAAVAWLALATAAHATANHTYKPGEFVVVKTGLSPDKRLSVAAHGEGEFGYDNFHLYLMAEPGHRKIGPLEEVGPDVLDTGADAYEARWTADSRHVALLYRIDRHVLTLTLYRIENRRAYVVTGPGLLGAAMGKELQSSDGAQVTSSVVRLSWSGPRRFLLVERGSFKTSNADLAHKIGGFGKVEREPSQDGGATYLVDYSVQAACELTSDDKFRILDLKPGRLDD